MKKDAKQKPPKHEFQKRLARKKSAASPPTKPLFIQLEIQFYGKS